MRPVSSSLDTQSYDPSVDEHNLTALLTASDPTSDPASDSVSDSVSDSATLQPCEQLTDPEIMQSSLRYELPRGVKRASQQARLHCYSLAIFSNRLQTFLHGSPS